MNSSPLNPDAPVFIPGSVPSDVLLAESPRKPMPMDDIELPDVAQFQTEAVVRPAELLDLDNCDQLNGHHNVSISDAAKERLNGNDKCTMDSLGFGFNVGIEPDKVKDSGFIQDFERIQKDTTDFCNIQVFQTHSETNPFAVEGNDELFERLKNKERDPMSMSFYQEKDDDTCERLLKNSTHVDLNAVQPLPDSDDEDLQTNGICDNDKENVSPDQHTDMFAAGDVLEPNNDIMRFDERTDLSHIANFGQGDNCMEYLVSSSHNMSYPNIELEPANIPQDTVLQTDTPESHKLLFEQIPEIPDGKSSELGFTNDDNRDHSESEKDIRASSPQDETSQDIEMESKLEDSPLEEFQPELMPSEPVESDRVASPESIHCDVKDNEAVVESFLAPEIQQAASVEQLAASPAPADDTEEAITPEPTHGPTDVAVDVHRNASDEIQQSTDDVTHSENPFGYDPLEATEITFVERQTETEFMSAASPAPALSPVPSDVTATSPLPVHSPVPSDAPAESPLPVQSPEPSDAVATSPLPSEAAVPSPLPSESPAQETLAQTASPAPSASPAPCASPAPFHASESSLLAHSPLPVESFVARESPLPDIQRDSPLPTDASLPRDSPLPSESPLPRETEAPVEACVPAESPLPAEIIAPTESHPVTASPLPADEQLLVQESKAPEVVEAAPSPLPADVPLPGDSPAPPASPAPRAFTPHEPESEREPTPQLEHELERPAEIESEPLAVTENASTLDEPAVAAEPPVVAAEEAPLAAAPAPDLVPESRGELVTDVDVGVSESRAQEICVPVTCEIRPEDGEHVAATPPPTPAVDAPAVDPLAAAAGAAAVAATAALAAAAATKSKTTPAKKSPTTPVTKTDTRTPKSALKPSAASPRTPASATKRPASGAAPRTPASAPRTTTARTPTATKTALPTAAKPATAAAKASPAARIPAARPAATARPASAAAPPKPAAKTAAPASARSAPAPRAAPATRAPAARAPLTRPATTGAAPRPTTTTAAAKPAPRPAPPAMARPTPAAAAAAKTKKLPERKPLTNGEVKETKPAPRPAPISRPAPRPAPRAAPAAPAAPKAAAPRPATRAPLDKQSKDLANKRITAKAAPPRTAPTKAAVGAKNTVNKVGPKKPAEIAPPVSNGLPSEDKAPPSPPAADNALLPDVIA